MFLEVGYKDVLVPHKIAFVLRPINQLWIQNIFCVMVAESDEKKLLYFTPPNGPPFDGVK